MAKPGACPSCGRPVGRRDRICTGCGWNLRTKAATKTRTGKPGSARTLGDGLLALAIAVGGSIGELAFFAAARGDPGLTRAFQGATAVAAGLVTITVALIGFHEDGLIGVLYRLQHPLGTILAGDDRAPWTWFAIAWLLLLAGALSLLLMA